MSGQEWQPRDAGSGAGRMQRVASDAEFVRHQTAYLAYLDHASNCPACAEAVCPEARRLWRVVKGREDPDE